MRRFFRDGFIYAAAGAFSGGLNLILLPIYAHQLSPNEYGVLELLTLVSTLVNLTVAFEVSQGVARFYPKALTNDERISMASSALWFSVVCYGGFVAIALLGSASWSRLILGDGFEDVWRIAAIAMATLGIFNLTRHQLRWQLRPVNYALANLAGGGVTLLFAFFFVHFGVMGALTAQIAGSLCGVIYALLINRGVYRLRFDASRLRAMLGFSAPLVLSSVGIWAVLYVDRISINSLLGAESVGIYAVAYRVATVISVLTTGFQNALTPLVYQHHAEPETPFALARIFTRFVAASLMVLLGLSLFSREIVSRIAPSEYAQAAPLIAPLTASMLCSGVYVFAVGLGLAKRTGVLAMVNLMSAVLNLGLNLWLIPQLGLIGSALATLVSAMLGSALQFVLGHRFYPVPYPWVRVGFNVVLITLIIWLGMRVGVLERLALGAVGILVIGLTLWRLDLTAMSTKRAM
jgi:O-antigen/teichoic acid export membrane protein